MLEAWQTFGCAGSLVNDFARAPTAKPFPVLIRISELVEHIWLGLQKPRQAEEPTQPNKAALPNSPQKSATQRQDSPDWLLVAGSFGGTVGDDPRHKVRARL